MQSVIWQEAKAEGRKEGRAEGQLKAEREVCRKMVERYHPPLLGEAVPTIEACTDLARLQSWIVEAPALSDEEYRRLLNGSDGS